VAIRTFTARDLNQRSGVVTQAVDEGNEVIITKHGKAVYRIVLVDLPHHGRSLLDVMSTLPDTGDIDVDFPRLDGPMREIDL